MLHLAEAVLNNSMFGRFLPIPTAVAEVLRQRKLFVTFLILGTVLFWIFVTIPTRTIPGNSLAFQLSVLTTKDYFLLITLSALTSLAAIMNIYILANKITAKTGAAMAGQTGVGWASGIIASIFGTVSCSACVAALFGFLGVGGVFFLLKWRVAITVFAIILLLISLYLTSLKILGICKNCSVPARR